MCKYGFWDWDIFGELWNEKCSVLISSVHVDRLIAQMDLELAIPG